MKRPRLLFVRLHFPFPLDEGGKIRTVGILRAMKGCSFEIVLASAAPPNLHAYSADIASVCDRFVSWPEPSLHGLRRVLALAGPLPVSVAGDRSSSGIAAIRQELAARPDLVVVDFPHSAVLVPGRFDGPSLLFTHNVETEIFERHAEMASGLWRLIWRRETAKMRSFEDATLRRFTTVMAVSERDARVLHTRFGLDNVAVIDTGVDLDFYGFHPSVETTRTVVFSGAMDSYANIDGITFLMDEVWPLVVVRQPDARMLVVGRRPPAALVAKAERRKLAWRFTGFVDDIRPHVLAGDVSVIPLRVGSGTRLKAFEAMALGRPVVSTSLGVEGLAVEPNRHFLAADTAELFAAAIVRLIEDAALRQCLVQAARSLLEARFSWSAIGRQFEAICRRTAAQRG